MSATHAARAKLQTTERKDLARTLPTTCLRCGGTVTADMPWDVDHEPPLSRDPNGSAYVSHRLCNQRAGGWRLANENRRLRKTGQLGVPPGVFLPRHPGNQVFTLALLTLVAVLSLITQVIGVSGGKQESDETQRLLRDVQQAVTSNPGNPASPMPEEPKK
jgi:hypothetical protein